MSLQTYIQIQDRTAIVSVVYLILFSFQVFVVI